MEAFKYYVISKPM